MTFISVFPEHQQRSMRLCSSLCEKLENIFCGFFKPNLPSNNNVIGCSNCSLDTNNVETLNAFPFRVLFILVFFFGIILLALQAVASMAICFIAFAHFCCVCQHLKLFFSSIFLSYGFC